VTRLKAWLGVVEIVTGLPSREKSERYITSGNSRVHAICRIL